MQSENLKSKVVSGLFWSYGEKFLAQAITLIVSIILARLLSPTDYGTIAIVMVLINICNALVTGGFGNALIHKKDANETDFNSICWFSIAVSFILYIILFIIAPYIAKFYNSNILTPVIRVMGIKFVILSFNSVQQAYVQRKMMFKKFFFATLGGTIISAIIGILMAYKGFGVWALVTQYLTNSIIDTIILYITIEWKPKREISKKSIKQLWGFGSKMLISTMVYTLKDNIRSLLIGKKFTKADLAYYNQGQRFPSLLVQDIVDSIGKVIFPVLCKKQDSKTEIKKFMRKSIKVSSYILNPCIIGLFAVADVFVQVTLTDKWLPCVPYIRILCVVYAARSMSTIFQKCLLSIGRSGFILIHETFTSVLTILLIVLAIFVFNSVEMVAWSYVIVMLSGITLFYFLIHMDFEYKITELAYDFLPSFMLSIIMGLIAYFIGKIKIVLMIKLFIQIIVGIIIYIVLSIIFKIEEFIFVKDVIKKIINKKTKKA